MTTANNARTDNDIDLYAREVILTILGIIRTLRHSGTELLTEVELSYPQSLLLFALLETGKATIGELAQHLQVTQGVVSRMVDRLVEKEMLKRERFREDRRVVYVSLSQTGRDYAEKMISYHLDSLKSGLLSVSEVERVAFLAVLRHISDRMKQDERNDEPKGLGAI